MCATLIYANPDELIKSPIVDYKLSRYPANAKGNSATASFKPTKRIWREKEVLIPAILIVSGIKHKHDFYGEKQGH